MGPYTEQQQMTTSISIVRGIVGEGIQHAKTLNIYWLPASLTVQVTSIMITILQI